MGIIISVAGYSGTGKSTSLRTLVNENGYFDDDTILVRVLKKPLPFRNKLRQWDKEKGIGDYVYIDQAQMASKAIEAFAQKGKKRIIIDDSTFFMTKYFMDTALQRGYDKFTENALHYYNALVAAENTPEDTRVYFINHLEETAGGMQKIKTIGKMLDEKVDIPAMMTIVLQSLKDDEGYWFLTNKRTDYDIAKSPIGMFDSIKVPNDLALVDKAVCEYYGI
jgi:hypothetical protein